MTLTNRDDHRKQAEFDAVRGRLGEFLKNFYLRDQDAEILSLRNLVYQELSWRDSAALLYPLADIRENIQPNMAPWPNNPIDFFLQALLPLALDAEKY